MIAAKRDDRQGMATSLEGDAPAYPTTRSATDPSPAYPELAKVELMTPALI